MEWLMLLLGLALGLIIGTVAAWYLLTRHDGTRKLIHQQLADSQANTERLSAQLTEAQQNLAAARGRLEEIERRRAEEAEAAQERESLLEMLHPVRQGVTEMQRRIQELERERSAQHSRLSQQLSTAAESDAKIIESTQALLGSLHSTSARGHWGEVQLRRVVEAAGMLSHVDFAVQHTGTNPDGEVLRPDMVVHLPGGRQLIIDAKAPLNATDPRAQAKALRGRVEELAKKRYWDAVELSPDVVFCFVPAESLLSAALETDPQLLDWAMARGVALVSPASLLASLKAVETAWRQERVAANIKEVVDHSRELYRRLAAMSKYLEETGARLSQAVGAYNKLIGNIERRVLPQAETLSRLEVADSAKHGAEELTATVAADHVATEVNPLGPRLRGHKPAEPGTPTE
ncbi:DNA recombination protein RmuC [Nesterenkonia muleiensis]|uniref:DNA recombination protein RmuC n=1 Tax=Nesterenkonia muleiensis TaxID=2282648 RepID=UPI000E7681A8|nr:DNA recombination protein RmuC [Nesterenkonia muleiensis]